MRCPACDEETTTDRGFCDHCGMDLTARIARPLYARRSAATAARRPPKWRSRHPGWIAANVAFGLVVLGALQLFVWSLAMAVAGRDPSVPVSPTAEMTLGGTLLVAVLVGATGWLLFVYLPPASPRGLVLAMTLVGASTATVITGLAIYPTGS